MIAVNDHGSLTKNIVEDVREKSRSVLTKLKLAERHLRNCKETEESFQALEKLDTFLTAYLADTKDQPIKKNLKRKHTPCNIQAKPRQKKVKTVGRPKAPPAPTDSHNLMAVSAVMNLPLNDPEWPELMARNEKAIKVCSKI